MDNICGVMTTLVVKAGVGDTRHYEILGGCCEVELKTGCSIVHLNQTGGSRS
jgi:hypothetical protein